MVFLGSPDFALPSLEALDRNFNVVGVITQPDRPAGRGQKIKSPDVKVLANILKLPLMQPRSPNDGETIDKLNEWSPDVIVVAAYGKILREPVLNLPRFGCVNVHASLLPRWRGAAPVQAAVLHDDVTGVTIMKMDQGLDTGPIISQRSIPIAGEMTAGNLFEQLARLGADLLVDTLPKYIRGDIEPQPQDDRHATYAPSLKKEDGKLDFHQPAWFLARQVRAYHPWPGTYQTFDGKRLKVFKAYADESHEASPGQRTIVDYRPAWGTVQGLIVLEEVQLEGKSQVSGEQFLRGAKNWVPTEEERS